ncbi:hypothetical protein [Pleionea litopenaei]|uniref:Uncharacterized protein n=1 Tax=Pleionea litopenaei TaxID=3070815 RepID=A0AA51X5V4_9GAMM|nr:hypothetical protein [Pleionea sp. HL-JVS1]WMS86587.1 hypothetical protein Q9312_15305 [Pleionea sp. HL-JVS1]
MANYFSMEIKAPDGLSGIEAHLSKCRLSLNAYTSGHNGKVVLRAKDDSDFEWSMDSSDGEIVFGSGEIFKGVDFTIKALESLSLILRTKKLPHVIWVDDENGCLIKEFNYGMPNT